MHTHTYQYFESGFYSVYLAGIDAAQANELHENESTHRQFRGSAIVYRQSYILKVFTIISTKIRSDIQRLLSDEFAYTIINFTFHESIKLLNYASLMKTANDLQGLEKAYHILVNLLERILQAKLNSLSVISRYSFFLFSFWATKAMPKAASRPNVKT